MLKLKGLAFRGLLYIATGALVYLFRIYDSTMDIRAWGLENLRLLKRTEERPLLVLWHGKGFLPITYFHAEHLCLYASHGRSPDYSGWRLASRFLTLRFIERMGYRVLDASEFASESRGVLRFVKTLKEEGGAIAADGPGGPIFQAKPGACFLAKKSGVTLVPVGAAISKGVRLDQWDRFEIPSFFSRGVLVVEEPIRVEAGCSDEVMEQARIELEKALNRANKRAQERLESWGGVRTATKGIGR